MKRLIVMLILTVAGATGQSLMAQNHRDYIRRGNRQYRDSIYDKAQVLYQKGLEKDSDCVQLNYNQGNALLMQGQPKDAMRLYEKASKVEHDPGRRHQIFHNMGVILQAQKQFAPAIEAYKEALRNDPSDHETRYNMVLCQRQLKNQQQDQGGQDDKNGDQQDKDKQKQEQQQKQQQKNDKKEEQKQQQQQQQENQMSRENAEQMLNAAMQNERQTQDKVKQQQQQARPRRLQKQW
ncbi:MAG: tetratricopeptide repeat protein [Bacteroidaceae bacterium]|nr:tetratricopeptide repeat protein [Bacteroidaceae bacterium]